MKRFKTDYQGLLPIYLNDIRFVNDSLQEQIEAMLKSLTAISPNFIISGCNITGTYNNGTLSSGYVVLSGKIYRVPSQTLSDYDPGNSSQYQFYIQEQILQGGSKQPKRTTNIVETYFEDIAILQSANGGILFNDCPRLEGNQLDFPWQTLQLDGNFTHDSNQPLQYKRCGNVIEIRGMVANNSQYGNKIAVLPAEIRPKRELTVPCAYYAGGFNFTQLTLSENGDMIYGADSDNTVYIQVQYFLT